MNRKLALQVLALGLAASTVSGCHLYNRYAPWRRAMTQSTLRAMPPLPSVPPPPSNDAIEKTSRRLAGSGNVFYWRSTVNHTYEDNDALIERSSFDRRALAAFKARQPFVLIHDDENMMASFKPPVYVTKREAFVLTTQKQLLHLSTRIVSGAPGQAKIKSQKVKRLIWVPGLDIAAMQQVGAK